MQKNGFNPSDILTDFDYGEVSTLENGQTLREYFIAAYNRISRLFRALITQHGRITGASLVQLFAAQKGPLRSASAMAAHPHTIHFHGIHPAEMDGVPGAGRA